MVFLCCVTTVGCSYSNPRQQIEEDVYYSASETNNKISYKDYENVYKLCNDIVDTFYSYSMTKASLDSNNYSISDKLAQYKEKCFKKYAYRVPVTELVITNAVDDIEWFDDYVYISFATIVEYKEDNMESSFSDNNQFLVVNDGAKLKVVDWITKGMGGVGSIDSTLRKDEKTLDNINKWEDDYWAAQMLKLQNSIS